MNSGSVLLKPVRFLGRLYSGVVWFLFHPILLLCCGKRGKAPDRVRSVLHVSILSHKPYMLSRLMRQKGLRAEYLAIGADVGWLKLGERGYDYNIPTRLSLALFRPWIAIYYLLRVVRHFDVIHYHFISLLAPGGQELEYLKRMGKVVVFHFRGCDVRQKSVNDQLNPDLNCCQECDYPEGHCDNESQRRKIALARRYGDLLFVTTPDLLDFVPEAEHVPFVAPFGTDVEKIESPRKKNGAFRIVTSSNHDGIDGTKYTREAVKRLRDEGRAIELVEVHSTPYEEALSIYKSADVFVGRLRMGYYNNANIECMMMGIPNMSYIRDEFLESIPDCPIIVTCPENVYQRLKEYVNQPERLKDIGRKGPGFVIGYHDPDEVANKIIARYNKTLLKS